MEKNGVDSDKEGNEEKPSWLLTAQKIYPMSDDKYYKLLESARRSAKIDLNRLNAFTPPSYQRRYIESRGEGMVVGAAMILRRCRLISQKMGRGEEVCKGAT